jgi:hypothetical protein
MIKLSSILFTLTFNKKSKVGGSDLNQLTRKIAISVIIGVIVIGIGYYGISQYETDQKVLQNTWKLSKQGKTINSESFGIGSSRGEIEKTWGKPDGTIIPYSKGESVVYQDRQIQFIYDASNKVDFIETFDKRLINKIPLSKVRKILGKPVREGNDIVDHRLDLTHGNLTFTFPVPSDQNHDPRIQQVYLEIISDR